MEFRILGPLEAYDSSGAEIGLPAGRERALVAALVLRRGEVVPTDALIDALWGERPPTTAAKAVQGYVSHLRRALGDGLLITRFPGYVLRVDAESIDAERFEQLATQGRRALEDADPGGAPSGGSRRRRIGSRPCSSWGVMWDSSQSSRLSSQPTRGASNSARS